MLALSTNGRLYKTYSTSVIIGHKYYVAAYVKSVSSLVHITMYSTDKFHSGNGNYEHLSLVHTATTATNSMSIYDNRTSGWDNVYAKYIFVFDLTSTFGPGNEPTAAQMDVMLQHFPNSWFNGTDYIQKPNS